MKIAVVGAGISGVTCARELNKLGHEVEIFEMASKDKPTRPRQMEGSINLLYNIPEIEPDNYMKKIKLHSQKYITSGKGKYGFFYEVGGTNGIEAKARKSIEQQIPIHYSTKIEDKTQLTNFQVIVAADGYRSLIAKKTGLHTHQTPSQVGVGIGYTVKGDFDPELIEVWLDNYHSFHGYSYAIPFSQNEASLVSVWRGKTSKVSPYRQRLKELALSRNWEILNEWVDFESWHEFLSYSSHNIYVIGNAASFTDPALGFGLKWAIQSAKLCAKAIYENIDYNVLVQEKILPDLESFQVVRKFFDNASNDDYSKFVKRLENPLVKKLAESGKTFFKHKGLMQAVFSTMHH
jgi:digeranylgeranylglycerophospholipid reductase